MELTNYASQSGYQNGLDNRPSVHLVQINSDCSYNPSQMYLVVNHSIISLTPMEQKVVRLLLKNKGTVVEREDLMMLLWQTCEYISEGALTTCISRLRRKLKSFSSKPLIETVKGVGYMIPDVNV